MRTTHPLLNVDYHIAFTFKATDPAHCEHCADKARIREGIHTHIRLLLEEHTEVDLLTPEGRYRTTAAATTDGALHTFDRYAAEPVEHFTDPVQAPAYAGRQYAKN